MEVPLPTRRAGIIQERLKLAIDRGPDGGFKYLYVSSFTPGERVRVIPPFTRH